MHKSTITDAPQPDYSTVITLRLHRKNKLIAYQFLINFLLILLIFD